MDYGNNKSTSVHCRLGSATLLLLAFPGESNPNFPQEKSHWDNTVKSKNKKVISSKAISAEGTLISTSITPHHGYIAEWGGGGMHKGGGGQGTMVKRDMIYKCD